MGKRRKAEAQPLSDYWKPPADTGIEDGVGEPVACLATTFEFDAGFFEEELVPRFLGLRFDHTENQRTFIIEREEALATTRVAVLVDASKFDPRQTTLQWDQLPIQVPGGIQHAKLTLLVWERLARLIVGSANLTRQGYRRNREVFAAIDFFDSQESATLRLLRDALDFVETLCAWSRSLPAATERIRQTVQQIRMRARRWSSAPEDFSPRERPRATLVVGHPAHPAGAARSVVDQVIRLWQPRRVKRLAVMTPLVGQRDDAEDDVLARLCDLPMARNAEGWLIAPEKPSPEGATRRVAALPEQFARCWASRFRQNAFVLLVPPCVERNDELPRVLHAKAILISGDLQDLLMIGSSNFTPHGMGVEAFNCEANLVFEDRTNTKRGGQTFDERLGLPVDWEEAVGVEDVAWEEADQSPEDAPAGQPHLPAFFAWASYSQKTGEIRVGLDRSQDEPSDWAIRLVGQDDEQNAVLFSRGSSPNEATTLRLVLDATARRVQLVALKVRWQDTNLARHEAYLAVSVEHREDDLLPPEELRSLTVDGIIECLLSGREPADWIERQDARRKRAPSTDAAIESLRAVDTSNYLLYRAKRLGRALAAMASRIASIPRTREAIRYWLLRDPLGPVHLAEALSRDGQEQNGGPLTTAETGYRLYALAEIVLTLGHVGRTIRRESKSDWKQILPLFHEARERLGAMIEDMGNRTASLSDDLKHYLDATLAENARRLNIAEEE
jgi:hypothetical protein